MSQRIWLRHLWSHEALPHRVFTRVVNAGLRRVPFELKYGVGQRLRRRHPPYSLLREGSVVVQIGAPADTLHSGRSRAMHFALLVGSTGRVVVIEPDPRSAQELERVARAQGIESLRVSNCGAWKEATKIVLFVDDAHPATNFTEGSKDYDEARMRDYRRVEMDVDTVDNIVASHGLQRIDGVSITTNGAEREILEGMKESMRSLSFISLARTGEGYDELMAEYGFERIAFDDRGFTYRPVRPA
ncbi:MAG: FkbM family methyltransferase [Deltaproteobacteria bacterium]|nr:FkbM family methyltransferase [Deltaproteobacteria bacterium]